MVTLTSLVLAPAASAKTCAEKVIDDWYGNGRVDQIFPKHCYLEAIRSLPVDVKDYSNAEDDIRRALAYAAQGKPDPGPAGGPAPTGTTGEGPSEARSARTGRRTRPARSTPPAPRRYRSRS